MAAARPGHRGRAPARAAPARPAVRAARPSGRARVMAKIGYARVSTRSQNDDSQVDDLTAYGCDKIFTDTVSGKLAARPELDKALAYLREGDVLVITRLSRAMRSLKHLLALADELRERGVGLVVLKQQIDTTTPTGRLVFHILGAIDEFQRELIIEGTREGLDAARARGRTGGRKPKLSAARAATVRRMYARHRPGRQEAAHRRRDRPGRRRAPHHRLRLPQQGGLTWPTSPQDAPRHAGQVVRRVLLRRNIAIDAETAQLVADAVQAALQPAAPSRPPRRRPRGPAAGSEPLF